MENNNEKRALRRLEVDVTEETMEALEQFAKTAGVPLGDALEKLAIKRQPKDEDNAIWLAMEQITLAISGLPAGKRSAALAKILVNIAALMRGEDLDRLRDCIATVHRQVIRENGLEKGPDGRTEKDWRKGIPQ